MIQIEKLRKTYGARRRQVVAVDGVDLHVREGEVFGVLGQSGAGKSTLLRCINLLERPDQGRIIVDGSDVLALRGAGLRRARQGIGMIHQHFGLLSSRTVAGNVAFPLEVMGVPRAERARRVRELLELVGLGERAKAYPAQLSGGQKQRVGIARALAGRPKVLLSDEATSALDPETTRSILELLRHLNRELNLTILLITHEMEVVKRICDSVAIMQNGRFTESGRILDLLATPGSELAAGLFPLPSVSVPAQPARLVTTGLRQAAGQLADVESREGASASPASSRTLDAEVLEDTPEHRFVSARSGTASVAGPPAADQAVTSTVAAPAAHAAPSADGALSAGDAPSGGSGLSAGSAAEDSPGPPVVTASNGSHNALGVSDDTAPDAVASFGQPVSGPSLTEESAVSSSDASLAGSPESPGSEDSQGHASLPFDDEEPAFSGRTPSERADSTGIERQGSGMAALQEGRGESPERERPEAVAESVARGGSGSDATDVPPVTSAARVRSGDGSTVALPSEETAEPRSVDGDPSRAGIAAGQAASGVAASSMTTIVDVTFVGDSADRPFISALARTYSIDVNILGGSVEQVGDVRVGRLRIELPGSVEVNAAQLAFLRESGLTLDVHGDLPSPELEEAR